MAFTPIADAVVAIPFGDGTKKKYRTVGRLLQADTNDASKGLPYVLMLDKTFNPAGVPGDDSIAISFYHIKEKEKYQAAPEPAYKPRKAKPFDGNDDDIPF